MSEEGKSAEDGFHALRVGEGELEADVGDDGEAVLRLTSELARDLSEHNGFVPRERVLILGLKTPLFCCLLEHFGTLDRSLAHGLPFP